MKKSVRHRPRPGNPVSQEFNPNSVDATIATVIERLDSQDEARSAQHGENKNVLSEILQQAKLTNGRVTKLETIVEGHWKYLLGIGAGISAAAAIVIKLLSHFF